MRREVALKIIQDVRQTYNQIASKFSQTRTHLWPELLYFKQFLANGQDILDLGCGNGRLLQLLDDVQGNYIGVDISNELIKKAQEQHPDKQFLVGDMLSPQLLENKQFDIIFLVSVFQHIPSNELRIEALNNVKRLLKPKGKILMINWNLWQKKYLKLVIKFWFLKIFSPNKEINQVRVGDLDFNDMIMTFKDNETQTEYRYLHAFKMNELSRIFNSCGFKSNRNFKTKFNLVSVLDYPSPKASASLRNK